MMRGSSPTCYWDTCIFVMHLSQKATDATFLDGIEEVVRLINDGALIVVTSVITRIEILDSKLTDKQRTAFTRFFDQRQAQLVAVDPRIADLAHEVRNHYRAQGLTISTPDAIHLATAIQHDVRRFLTTDGHRGTKKRQGLLQFSGDVMGHRLVIETPTPLMRRLPFPADNAADRPSR